MVIVLSTLFISVKVLADVDVKTNTKSVEVLSPEATEEWEPKVAMVKPSPVPSDAVILFNGSDLNQWQHNDGKPAAWLINQDKSFTLVSGAGRLQTKDSFCDVQLHIEWRSPNKISGKSGQQLGNSGIFLMERYELQILDSYQNQTYSNGQAGAVYKQYAPLVNATAPTGEWNTYDIIFTAPKFDQKGHLLSPAYLTALHNGVLIQNHVKIQGSTTYKGLPVYKPHGCSPISLQDHHDEVSFRNIWLRAL